MRAIFILFTLMLVFASPSFSQKIRVTDSNGERLPFFTLKSSDSNLVRIGNEIGEMDLSDITKPLCGIEIRYLGFEPFTFCDSILIKGDVTLIKLKESLLELTPVDVKTVDEKRVFENFRFRFKEDIQNFNLLKGQYMELNGSTEFHSFGVLAYSGLIDRNEKANRFTSGNVAFFHQKQLLANIDPNEIPYRTSFAYLSQFINDLFVGIILSKKNEFEALESQVIANSNFITYINKSNTIKITISEKGSILKISLRNTSIIAVNGIPININQAEVDFFESQSKSYIAKINMVMNDQNRDFKLSYLTHGLPYDIQLPDRLTAEKEKMEFFNAAISHSSSPDYTFSEEFFLQNEILESIRRIRLNTSLPASQNMLQKAYQNPYLYFETMSQSDKSSVEYMKKISEFVTSLNLTFQNNDLGWYK